MPQIAQMDAHSDSSRRVFLSSHWSGSGRGWFGFVGIDLGGGVFGFVFHARGCMGNEYIPLQPPEIRFN